MNYLNSDGKISLISGNISTNNILENKIYQVEFNKQTSEYYLSVEAHSSFNIPFKLYFSPENIVNRVLTKYNSSDKSLGILLNGEKGSGKSLTAKMICNESNLPIIIIRELYDTGSLVGFLSKIDCPFVLFIDEFDKIYYDDDDQEGLLPLLDGWGNNKVLYILTGNKDNRTSYLINRPSRIFYVVNYNSLKDVEIKEVMDYELTNKQHSENILKICLLVGSMNLDLLISIIKEVNLFDNSDVDTLLYYLNIQTENSLYLIKVVNNKENYLIKSQQYCNPLSGEDIEIYGSVFNISGEEREGHNYKEAILRSNDITSLESNDSLIRITTKDFDFTFTKIANDIKYLI